MLITTSYRLHISNFLKEKKEQFLQGQLVEPYNKLLLHQYLCTEYFYEKKPRGILLYHELGTGKTMTAVSCSHKILDSVKGVLFIAKLSVHENFRSTIEKFAGKVSNKYKFISLIGKNMKKNVIKFITEGLSIQIDEDKIDANDYLIVVDEAHNLFSSITNGSENATFLYKMIMRSKCRLIFMTGSPALKESYELAICFNMLMGYLDSHTLFGESYENFNRYFIKDIGTLAEDTKSYDTDIKNIDIFGDRITGLVSFYKPTPEQKVQHFPEQFGPFIIRSYMSNEVYDMYKFYRAIERKEISKGQTSGNSLGIPKGNSSSTYRVMTRQISNFLYPEHAFSKYYDQRGNLKYEFHLEDLTEEDFTEENLAIYSPKLLSLMQILKMHSIFELPNISEYKGKINAPRIRKSPGVIYSQYLDFGLKIIAKCLEAHSFCNWAKNCNKEGPQYAIISGEIEMEEQNNIIKRFNDPKNADGSVLQLLLISATGAEGLDTKRGGHVHIFEPHWHDSRHKQIFGRLGRYDSHIDLAPEDRNFCSYVYLSDYPKAITDMDEYTTDITLYKKARARQGIIDRFLKLMRINAIDCPIYSYYDKCRICNPTDESLIINSLEKHLDYGSRCVLWQEEQVEAYPFVYEGQEYYFFKGKKGEIAIIIYEPLYGHFTELSPSTKNYYNILAYAQKIYDEMTSKKT